MRDGLQGLGAGAVITADRSDVAAAKERSRRLRLWRLAAVLAPLATFLWFRMLEGHPVRLGFPHIPPSADPYIPGLILVVVLGLVLIVPMLSSGRSPHVVYRPDPNGVRLSDVKGLSGVVREVVGTLNLFLANETFSQEMGGTPRRGLLFEGLPGTGKTFVAKAMANEAGVPFFFVSSSAFQSMYYGQTNRKIRSFFKALRAAARAEGGAIGFIEEIDAVGGSRAGMGGGSGNDAVPGVVNELLVQLQSFDAPPFFVSAWGTVADSINRFLPTRLKVARKSVKPANVLVIGATNRAADLDPALVRPGRFDRSIHFDLPSRVGRREIIDHYLAMKSHDADLDAQERRDELAGLTLGYTPVMLERLLDEGLVWALRRGDTAMNWDDISKARLTEELGMTNHVSYSEAERRRIASHEAGHATVAWLLGVGRRLEVLSIIKRGDALGLLAHSEVEERFTKTRSELHTLIQIAMGGLVAEELLFGEGSSGPGGDLATATRIACQMVGSFGMAGSLISMDAMDRQDLTSAVLRDEAGRLAVDNLLNGAYREVTDLLSAQIACVEALRDALLEEEELIGERILQVLLSAGKSVDGQDQVELKLDLSDSGQVPVIDLRERSDRAPQQRS